jgi:hypothetical protein
MIPHSPSESHVNTDFTSGIRHLLSLAGVVPHASERSNHELLHANDEGDDPKQSEKVEPEHVLGLRLPLDGRDERVFNKHRGSNAVKVNGTPCPNDENWDNNKISNDWKSNDPQVLCNKLRSNLHDCGSERDVFPAAANADHVSSTHDPCDVSTCLCHLVVIGAFLIVVHMHIAVCSQKDEGDKNDNHGNVKQRLGDPFE